MRLARSSVGRQEGITLIELLVALTLGAMIALAVAIGIHQILTGTTQTTNHNNAINQVRTAEHWISRDARMAKPGNVVVNNNPAEATLLQILLWVNADGTSTSTITYTLQEGTLQRDRDGELTFVADSIRPKESGVTECHWDDSTQVLSVTITAEVFTESETRTFEVRARPDPPS